MLISFLYQLTILGTPAEEGFGGKVDLIKAGAFNGIDVAMMSHPFPENDPTPIMLAREKYMPPELIFRCTLSLRYFGQ